ncbi:hypothetical protein Fleli_3999 [Bernardetia litoralis DSM 6794]|uniref:Lipoprotein n=1 Tax=Bernardetia litoralis (strain ATCC 23117 / DSM 6794 / NBRC 15988 / NCIMB 1366 / Fx l1 / Sio-4) TaxID=880071 RepID=I4AQR6_BERLS|nr:hypothetical protein [Bernardetia litoralis]AFM06301.1 hypothetical protein Fleli_3999 [Bernardetia litoralis DSM 6794]
MKTNYSFFLLFIFLLISCQNSDSKIIEEEIKEEKSNSFIQFLKDTTTKTGFEINYKIKENSKGLVIQIKKDTLLREIVFSDLLDKHIRNCPVFIEESTEYLYFRYYFNYGKSLWVLKKSTLEEINYGDIVGEDFERNLILYLLNNNPEEKFRCNLVNLTTNKTQEIIFDGFCKAAETNSCIKEVIFEKDSLTIKGSFWKDEKNENEFEFVQKIKL